MNEAGQRPVVLVILDGWGIGREEPGNAILAARTPTMDSILANWPHTTLLTSGPAVGLPEGQMGNSEVGHLNIGAGFIVYQWISRIDKAIAEGELAANETLGHAIDRCIADCSTLHIGGLLSDGGVHSHIRHVIALVEIAADRGLKRIAVDAFMDGRDTAPTSGLGFVRQLQAELDRIGTGRIASIGGRYYAMDRDRRWERTRLAYDAIVAGAGHQANSALSIVERSYSDGITDEFIAPTVIPAPEGDVGMRPADVFLFANFRSDRGRQLTQALAVENFDGFERSVSLAGKLQVITLTRYWEDLPVDILFETHDIERPLARVISDAGLCQFHCAETEKYPHVTFFLNGGREDPFPGEDRALIPSPKVATYDLQPEMSAAGVGAATIAAIDSGAYDFIVVNFANPDMVGHTGDFDAAVQAVETVDTQLGLVLEAAERAGGVALVIADHGNAEEMIDRETGGRMTAHTTNPVPCVLVGSDVSGLRDGSVLSAMAPTILQLLGLEPPVDMATPSLLIAADSQWAVIPP